MPDALREAADLVKADEEIAAGEQRLANQIALIGEMEEKGQSTEEAEKVRRNYEDVLKTFREHRQLIVDTLKRA